MIRLVLIQNRQGKSRLSKFYVPYDEEEQVRIKGEVHRLIAPRDQKYQSNFVEVSRGGEMGTMGCWQREGAGGSERERERCRAHHPLPSRCAWPLPPLHSGTQYRNYKIVYRRYAGLFFCVCVDANDNELAYLEAIHFFVEVLDSFFGNVCELDLVFNFYKVYAILDEIFLAGEIEETSKSVVLKRLEQRESRRRRGGSGGEYECSCEWKEPDLPFFLCLSVSSFP